MSFAAARQTLSSTARASLRRTSAFRTGARRMNSSQPDSKPKSDKPWLIASALIFGPAFLYLVSPSARKTAQSVHHDAHDYPGHEAKAIAKAHAPTPAAAGALKENEPVPPALPPTSSATEQESEEGEPGAIRMKDDEGKEVDVSATLKKEEAEDVPKADGAPVPETEPETSEPAAETEETSSQESKEAEEKSS